MTAPSAPPGPRVTWGGDSEEDMGLFLSSVGAAGMDLAGCERNAGAEAPHSHGVPAGPGPSGAGTTS